MDFGIYVIMTIQLRVVLIVSYQNWKDRGTAGQFCRWPGSSTSTAAEGSLTAEASPTTDGVLRCVLENYEHFIILFYT